MAVIYNMGLKEKDKKLKQIKDQVLKCKSCPLYKTRKLPVIGQGNHGADILFIGEAPGKNEDETGIPFCGRAGNILNELLEYINLKRKDVYICNIIKCRPPQNRDPKPEEIKKCTPYLEKQLKIIEPKIICSLGRFAMTFLMNKYGLKNELKSISKDHGNKYDIKVFSKDTIFIPMYHPAVATYNPNMKDVLKKDFKLLQKYE